MNKNRTSLFLMANLGAEVSRLFSAREKKDYARLKGSFERAQKIINEIMDIPDMKKREEEVKILNEIINDLANETKQVTVQKKTLLAYFTPFAMRLMTSS